MECGTQWYMAVDHGSGQHSRLSVTSGATPFYGPGFWQTDMDVKKRAFTSAMTLREIRIWISNVFNKVNLSNPVTCVDCLDRGKILGAGSGRGYGYDLRFQF